MDSFLKWNSFHDCNLIHSSKHSVQRSHIDSHLYVCFNSCKRSKRSSHTRPVTTSVSHYTIPPQKFLVPYIQRRVWDSSRISPNLCSVLLLVGHNFTELWHNFYLPILSIVNLQKNDSLHKKIRGVVTRVHRATTLRHKKKSNANFVALVPHSCLKHYVTDEEM